MSQPWDESTSTTGTSLTGTRVDASAAVAEASESEATPGADCGVGEVGRAAIEGWEARDASGGDAMDVGQTR